IERRVLTAAASFAALIAAFQPAIPTPISMPIMAITIINSISEKPRWFFLVLLRGSIFTLLGHLHEAIKFRFRFLLRLPILHTGLSLLQECAEVILATLPSRLPARPTFPCEVCS